MVRVRERLERLERGEVDEAARDAGATVEQRDQRRLEAGDAGEVVGELHAHAERLAIGVAGDVRAARERLDDVAVGAVAGVRSRRRPDRAERADRDEGDAGEALGEARRIDEQPVAGRLRGAEQRNAGRPRGAEHEVAACDHRGGHGHAVVAVQVRDHAALAAVEDAVHAAGLDVLDVAGEAAFATDRVAGRGLDAHDLGAAEREEPAGVGDGAPGGDLDDAHAREGSRAAPDRRFVGHVHDLASLAAPVAAQL